MGNSVSRCGVAAPTVLMDSETTSGLPYTQSEVEEDEYCNAHYLDLLTREFVAEHPRLFQGHYFEKDSLEQLIASHDAAIMGDSDDEDYSYSFMDSYLDDGYIVRHVETDDGTTETIIEENTKEWVKNPTGGVGVDLWVTRSSIEESIRARPSRKVKKKIRRAVERYHAREERRLKFESQRNQHSEHAEFKRSLQKQTQVIDENRHSRLESTIHEVVELQQELDTISSQDLGGFEQRADLLWRIETFESFLLEDNQESSDYLPRMSLDEKSASSEADDMRYSTELTEHSTSSTGISSDASEETGALNKNQSTEQSNSTCQSFRDHLVQVLSAAKMLLQGENPPHNISTGTSQ